MFILDKMKTARLLEQALNTESLRRRVIANNIANVDVPHFKRSEVNFESQLSRVINQCKPSHCQTPSLMSDQKHIPFCTPCDPFSVNPKINLDYNTTFRNDGNNVDIEKEMVDSAKNIMRYNTFTQMIGGSFNKLKSVMRTIG